MSYYDYYFISSNHQKNKLSFKNTFKNLAFSACQCEGKDNRIPLLKEVFEAFPNTPINIDIKVNNSVLIKKVLKALPPLNVLHPVSQTTKARVGGCID